MKNILVIFGGKSVEHDISVITAMQVLKNFPRGFNFVAVYIDKDGHWWTGDNLCEPKTFLNFSQNCKHKRAVSLVSGDNRLFEVKNGHFKNGKVIDAAVVCCHGGNVEGGGLQGMLEMCKIPFTCPDYRSSVLCMDKVLTKMQLSSLGIKVADYVWFDYADFLQNKDFWIGKIEKEIGYPLILKPARLGSSVGVHICATRQELFTALEIASEYDNKILIEKYLAGCKEYACACMKVNDKIIVSNVICVDKGAIYSFDEKYLSDAADNKRANKAVETLVKKLCQKVYAALECDGVVRIDFLLSNKVLYVCEANTVPGSLAFNLFDSKFSDLLSVLIEECIKKKGKTNLLYDFNSDAIKHYIEIENLHKNAK